MSKKRVCDLCEKEIERTYVNRGTKKKAHDGRGSSVVKPSLRRRLLWWLVGGPIALRVWSKGHYNAWKKYDLCSSCTNEIKREVKERVEG